MKEKLLGKGHLIVHGITLEEAQELLKTTKFGGDWWTQANINRLDGAAFFAITTHGYPKTKEDEMVKINNGLSEIVKKEEVEVKMKDIKIKLPTVFEVIEDEEMIKTIKEGKHIIIAIPVECTKIKKL